MGFAGAMVVAMVADALLGWPNRLFARIGHPVTWLGWLIAALDVRWNRQADASAIRRTAGIAAALLVIALASGLAWIVQQVIPQGWTGMVLLGVLAWPLVAFRSLYDHVAAVRWPKMPPTALSRRCCGGRCSVYPASSATRRSTRSTP
jgi:adenosylcobinamide-phosphate synthase